MSGTIEDIAKKWLAEPAYNKVLFFCVTHSDKTLTLIVDYYWKSKHPHIYDI